MVVKKPTPKKPVAKKPAPKKAVQPKKTKIVAKTPVKKVVKQTTAQKKAADALAKKKVAEATAKKKAADTLAKKKAAEKAAYNKLTPAQQAYSKLSPLAKLEADNKTAIDRENSAYAGSKEKLNSDKWANGTIDDLKELGFDYSKEYADSQASAEGRAKLDGIASGERENKSANESTLRQIEQGVVNANNSLDHSFFQQMMAQGQAASDSGMNAGIQGDQNLRLGMNKQAQLASVYSQANEGKISEASRYNNQLMSFSDQKKTAAVEQLARASSIYQDGREKGFNNLLAQRESAKGYADTAYGQSQDRINQLNVGTDRSINRVNSEADITGMYGGKKTAAQTQRDTDNKLNQDRFAYDKKSGDRDFGLQTKQFDYQKKSGDRAFGLEKDQFTYTKKSGDREFAYKVKDGDRNFGLEQQKFAFSKSQAGSGGGGGGNGGRKPGKKSGKPGKGTPGDIKPEKGTPGANFRDAKKSSAQTLVEKYYKKEQKKINKTQSVVRRNKVTPMPYYKNKNLTSWQKMKMFGGG